MTKSLSGYEHADSVLNDLQTSKQYEKEKERQIRSARNIDPPNFRPLMKRKYSSGKLSNLNNKNDINDDIDINGISPITTNTNNRRGRREETTFEFKQNDHPDDESSTFIRAKTFILVRYIKQFILPCYSRIRHLYYWIEHLVRNRIDIKKIGLVILVGLVFVFMKVGLENETYSSSVGYQSSYRESNAIQQQQTTYITGYQASSQVPIPLEYGNFVELGEFVNAVTLIRMHREQQQMQQKQNEKNGRIRHRRLEEEEKEGDKKEEDKKEDGKDDTEDTKEDAQYVKEENDAENKAADDETKDGEDSKSKVDSADELDNVVDKAWEKAIQKNPELEKQQQKANLLKVHRVPFFWHSEYISLCCVYMVWLSGLLILKDSNMLTFSFLYGYTIK